MKKFKALWLSLMAFAFLYVVLSIDGKAFMTALQSLSPRYITLLIALQFFTWCLILWQWKTIFGVMQVKIPLKTLNHTMLIGTFYETITPAMKVGGEAAKIIHLKQHGVDSSHSAAIIATQKIISMSAFIVLSLTSLIVLPFYVTLSTPMRYTLWALVLALILFMILCIVFVKTRNKSPWLTSFKRTMTQHTSTTFIIRQCVLSLFIWSLYAFKAYILCQAFQLSLAFWPIAAMTFIAYLVGMAPISPGGLGSFEGVMVLLLSAMSVPLSISLSVAVLMRLFTHWSVFFISALYVFLRIIFKKKEVDYGKTQMADS